MTGKLQILIKVVAPYFSAALLALLLFLFFLAGIFVGYLKYRPEQKEPLSVVIETADWEGSENSQGDDIGDFIMHHEYFAADPEVLENPNMPEKEQPAENSVMQDVENVRHQRQVLDKIETGVPLVAVVIDDMGINQSRTKDIISLQAPLTSSFLTYGKNLAQLAADAKKAGHEIMIHVPMEPKVKANLAPDTLLTEMNTQTVEDIFENMLIKFNEISVRGINNHMGSKFTEDKEKLGIVMNILKQRKMFFLDSKTTASSKGRELAMEDGVDYAARDVFLDNENDYNYIMKQLALTENIARKKGFAVAICHPKSQTYLALKDWLKTLGSKNIRLVHVSEIVQAVNVEQ